MARRMRTRALAAVVAVVLAALVAGFGAPAARADVELSDLVDAARAAVCEARELAETVAQQFDAGAQAAARRAANATKTVFALGKDISAAVRSGGCAGCVAADYRVFAALEAPGADWDEDAAEVVRAVNVTAALVLRAFRTSGVLAAEDVAILDLAADRAAEVVSSSPFTSKAARRHASAASAVECTCEALEKRKHQLGVAALVVQAIDVVLKTVAVLLNVLDTLSSAVSLIVGEKFENIAKFLSTGAQGGNLAGATVGNLANSVLSLASASTAIRLLNGCNATFSGTAVW